jgi:hypothetical protein
VPPTEVLYASTFDPFGPYGAKPMSEAPFNPVAPALANAVRDATGVRLTALPLRRDRVYEQLNARSRALPSDPPPSDPLPSDPLPSDPLPSDPLPSDPLPSDPLPSDPLPSDPQSPHATEE